MSFGFRLRFFVKGPRFETEASALDLQLSDGRVVELAAARRDDVPLRDAPAHDYKIRGTGFSTFEEARQCGERLRRAIRKSSAELGIGFDVGRDVATLQVSDAIRSALQEAGAQLVDNVHGLVVFEEDPPPIVLATTASGHTSIAPDVVLDEWRRQYEADPNFDDPRTVLAFELYTASIGESVRARFLTLSTVVEVLARAQRLAPEFVALVDGFLAAAEGAGPDNDADWRSFRGRIRELKDESIRRACTRFIEEALGGSEAKEFDRRYKVRSALAHKGDAGPDVDLAAEADTLQALVARLLKPLGAAT